MKKKDKNTASPAPEEAAVQEPETAEAGQAEQPQAEAAAQGFAAGYDESFSPCAAAQAAYTLRIALGSETRGGVAVTTAELWMEGQSGEELYRLALHWPAGEVAA